MITAKAFLASHPPASASTAPDPLAEMAQRIAADPDLREVLLGLPAHRAEQIPFAREQARHCGLPVKLWRRCQHQLAELGLSEHCRTVNLDTGAPQGSSYRRTRQGDAVAALIEQAAA